MNKERRAKIERARALISKAQPLLEQALEILNEAKDEEEEYLENMSENLKGGENGMRAESAVDALGDICDSLDIDFDDIESNLDTAVE